MVLYVDCSEPVINHSGLLFGNRVDLQQQQRNVKSVVRLLFYYYFFYLFIFLLLGNVRR